METFVAKYGGIEKFEKVVYIGDGGNDFCPLLRMRSYVFFSFSRRLFALAG
jgi:pyridoxal phosphate phosphatase PHOSPHO2